MSTAEHVLPKPAVAAKAQSGNRTTAKHLPALGGLRALSVLLVMVSHAGLGDIVPGGLGVTVFFFISGFLITRLLLEERKGKGAIDFARFYARRFLRLAPALVVYVAVASIAIIAIGGVFSLPDTAAALFYYANYYQIFGSFQHVIAQAPDGALARLQSPFSILWSLAIEEHFYLLFPLTLALLAGNLRRALVVFACGLVAVLVWRLYLVHAGASAMHDRIYMGTDTRIDSILYGVVAAIIGQIVGDRFKDKASLMWGVCAFAGALMIGSLLLRNAAFRESYRYSLQGVALLPLIPALVFAPSLSFFRGMLEQPLLTYVGKLSYSLYLYQYLVVMLASWFCAVTGSPQYGGTWIAIFVVATPLLAMASYHGVEQPFLKWRRQFGSRA
ncbi:MAG TPA: acyltransferase [Caulobacterales bacterium]|nr:acyltransferase [Caulobacterales bacterium]